MSEFLMATWDGAGTAPPLMSVVRGLTARGHRVRVLADPVLVDDVRRAGAEHIPWRRAPHRTTRTRDTLFIPDWGPDGFRAMRDNLAVGPAAAFAADVLEEMERDRPAALLSEVMLLGPLVAAEAAGVPAIVLNPTINMVPTEGVPPFGPGFAPATTEAERERDRLVASEATRAWDEALPQLNAARSRLGLRPIAHVLDQGRVAARVLVMTSRAFDFTGPMPPTVRHVGPRLDDLSDCEAWEEPPGNDPLVLVALSSDFQDQDEVLRRAALAFEGLPVRAVMTTGRGVEPSSVPAPANVQVLRLAPHQEVLRHAAAVVTHGGHGTTIKALAAGLPLVCLPMGRDQHDVAARVVHRGAGIRLDMAAPAGEIAAAVREVMSNPGYRAAAAAIASTIADEVADDRAVEEIETVVAESLEPA